MYRTDFIREKKTDVNDVNESVRKLESAFSPCVRTISIVCCVSLSRANE